MSESTPLSGKGGRSGGRVLLSVPRPLRDLEGHALVAFFLRRLGHEVLLHTGPRLHERIAEEAPDAVVLDYLGWEERAEDARLARRLGMKVIVLPTSGLWEEGGHARAAGQLTGATGLLDCYLAWGEVARRDILEGTEIPESRVHAVGCSRFDLYSERFRALAGSRHDFLDRLGVRHATGPVVLWNTNTNHFARDWKQVIREQMRQGHSTEEEVLHALHDESTQFREHSAVILELARRHPTWTFVLKVHPLEPVSSYATMVRDTPNLHMAFDAPIPIFLHHCDVLVQRGCTTATEAWMLGKPVIELSVGQYHMQWASEEQQRGNHRTFTLEETDAAIVGYLAGRPVPEDQQRARRDYLDDFCRGADGHASERCAALIHQTLVDGRGAEDRARTRELAREARDEMRRREDRLPGSRLKDLLGVPRGTSLRFWKWKPSASDAAPNAQWTLTEERVEALYRQYAAVTGGAAPSETELAVSLEGRES